MAAGFSPWVVLGCDMGAGAIAAALLVAETTSKGIDQLASAMVIFLCLTSAILCLSVVFKPMVAAECDSLDQFSETMALISLGLALLGIAVNVAVFLWAKRYGNIVASIGGVLCGLALLLGVLVNWVSRGPGRWEAITSAAAAVWKGNKAVWKAVKAVRKAVKAVWGFLVLVAGFCSLCCRTYSRTIGLLIHDAWNNRTKTPDSVLTRDEERRHTPGSWQWKCPTFRWATRRPRADEDIELGDRSTD